MKDGYRELLMMYDELSDTCGLYKEEIKLLKEARGILSGIIRKHIDKVDISEEQTARLFEIDREITIIENK